ncbi:MAG: hypothetical protein V4708_09880, partial [Bacteroidota bacterium]
MENLPIFASPIYQQELEQSIQVDLNPYGADLKNGPIEFNIVGNDDLIDLSATTLHIKAKITKHDGTSYDEKAEVAFINNTLHSLFSDVIVTINDTIIEGTEHQYSMKAMIGTLFSYGEQTMTKQLFSSGFSKDDAGKLDDVTNKGYVDRKTRALKGASQDFYGKLFVDLFQQNKYMIGNVNMRIKLIRASSSYAIWCNMANERPKVVIESAKLYVRKVRLNLPILGNIAMSLSKGGVVHYPINRTEIYTIPAPAGRLDIVRDQLFYGKVPKLIVMTMVDSEAIDGVYAKNPYNFKHCNIKYLDLRIDGESKPILPLTPDFKNKLCLREYMSLLEAMNIVGKDACLPISYEEFLNGYTFFAWNTTSDYALRAQNPAMRRNIRLDLKFSEATTASVNILLYCIFDSTVMIDGSGNV